MTDAVGAHSSQLAALVVYSGTDVRVSQSAALVAWASLAARVRVSQHAALVPFINQAKRTRTSDEAALVVYATEPSNVPRTSQEFALVVWGTTPPGEENRSRAWSYTMDGHVFYVLDLGLEGTWVFDYDTNQWSEFETAGYSGWNMHVGAVWQTANRVVAGDLLNSYVWEMAPTDVLDEEFRPIEHLATGGVMTRSRVHLGVESVRLAGSIGQIQDDLDGISTFLRFSDDAGETWSTEYEVLVSPGQQSSGYEIAYRSLGSFMAPGRVFEFRDTGGMLRIDGADLFLEDFDDESELTPGYRKFP